MTFPDDAKLKVASILLCSSLNRLIDLIAVCAELLIMIHGARPIPLLAVVATLLSSLNWHGGPFPFLFGFGSTTRLVGTGLAKNRNRHIDKILRLRLSARLVVLLRVHALDVSAWRLGYDIASVDVSNTRDADHGSCILVVEVRLVLGESPLAGHDIPIDEAISTEVDLSRSLRLSNLNRVPDIIRNSSEDTRVGGTSGHRVVLGLITRDSGVGVSGGLGHGLLFSSLEEDWFELGSSKDFEASTICRAVIGGVDLVVGIKNRLSSGLLLETLLLRVWDSLLNGLNGSSRLSSALLIHLEVVVGVSEVCLVVVSGFCGLVG